jgi:tRNA-splicing ligase RtcB (3'-phosphate/5'-hydroxy nucleic acid ligase)
MGQPADFELTFGSTWHSTGRILSRKAAKNTSKGRSTNRELEDKGIYVRWTGRYILAEEIQEAYKDVS